MMIPFTSSRPGVSESRRGVTTELSAVGMVLRHVGVLNGDLIRFAVRR